MGRTWHLLRRRDQAGYVAVFTAIMASTVFFGMAALGVDTARWYVELENLQKAADAAALSGVVYMPNDLTSARAAAVASAAKNGYAVQQGTTVTVTQGERASQLVVTVSRRVANTFAASFGLRSSTMSRSATADYTAPAPMGSPCNTFGNEPPSQPAPAAQPSDSALPSTPFPNCSSQPNFWAAIQGPNTDKVQGDRYMTYPCSGTSKAGDTYGCSAGANGETRPEGYFFTVHVEKEALNTPIDVQLYDPAFVYTNVNCSLLGTNSSYLAANATNYMNDYTQNDGVARYDDVSSKYCSGDYFPGGLSSGEGAATTSYLLRTPTNTGRPLDGSPVSGCTKQFVGSKNPPTIYQMRKLDDNGKDYVNYNPGLASVFHQWVSLCSFTATQAGDYYLQVRTDVTTARGTAVANTNNKGTQLDPVIYTGNPDVALKDGNTKAGQGLNAFAMRAVPTANTALRNKIAVAGYASMPVLQNAASSTAKFNLIRALPGTRGQYIAFDFYDAADGAGDSGGTVRVIAPSDVTGSMKASSTIAGCRTARNDETSYTDAASCQVTVKNTTDDGQVRHMVIPIPSDYNCDPSTLGGCWFSVQVTFGGEITDFTTWDANIGGDPVRLVK